MDRFTTHSVIWAAKFGILLSLLGVLLAISQSSLMTADDLIPTALAIDFIISLPVVYFFLIRKTWVPKITVVPVFFASFLMASAVLPEGVVFMNLAGFAVVPAVEIGVLGYLGFRIYRTRNAYREGFDADSDLMERLRTAFTHELKPAAVARAAAFEVAIFVYAFLKWRRPKSEVNTYSYHRANGPVLVLGVFLFLIGLETIGLHFLIRRWSETLAWIATALSLYFALQIFAHTKALIIRPIFVGDQHLHLRCGILGDVGVPLSIIDSVDPVGVAEDGTPGLDLLPVGAMSQPNILLTLSEPVRVYGVYGMTRTANVIRFRADDPERFIEVIRRKTLDQAEM